MEPSRNEEYRPLDLFSSQFGLASPTQIFRNLYSSPPKTNEDLKETTLQGTITYPTYGKVKSSDSKVPAVILGYLSSMEDILVESTLHFYDLKGWGNLQSTSNISSFKIFQSDQNSMNFCHPF